jgi:hypothetical protein
VSCTYLVGRLVEVLLNVVERVLRHVGDPQVGVPPHNALHRLHLTCDITKIYLNLLFPTSAAAAVSAGYRMHSDEQCMVHLGCSSTATVSTGSPQGVSKADFNFGCAAHQSAA